MSSKQFGPISWEIVPSKSYMLIYSTNLHDEPNTEVNKRNYLIIQLFKLFIVLTLPALIKNKRLELFSKKELKVTKVVYLIKQYGFYIVDDSYAINYGITNFDNEQHFGYVYDKVENQTISGFLPWNLYTQTKHQILNNIGNVEIDFCHPKNKNVKPSNYPAYINNTRTFAFKKNKTDENVILANVRMEYKEWNRGVGYFKWLHYFNKPIKEKAITIIFYDDGYYEDMLAMTDQETSVSAFMRWCLLSGYVFVEEMPFSYSV